MSFKELFVSGDGSDAGRNGVAPCEFKRKPNTRSCSSGVAMSQPCLICLAQNCQLTLSRGFIDNILLRQSQLRMVENFYRSPVTK